MRLLKRRAFLVHIGWFSTAMVLPLGGGRASATDYASTTYKVDIKKFKFAPDKLTVKPGDVIIWTNFDIAPHTATANDESWDTGTLRKGESHSILVTKDMHLEYFCRFHPHMKASIQLK